MKQFKLRASCSGKIATMPRAKSETLSETTKSYLKEWATEQLYGYKNEIKNKYVQRGIQDEDLAINKAIELLDLPFALKNESHFEDDFFTGTPDLILPDFVIDVKCSWNCFTFPIFEHEIPTKDYYYQLQIYMHLTGLKRAKLVYVLLDNESIGHIYPNDAKRVKTFDIDFDANCIDFLRAKVDECRNFLKELL